MKPKQGSWWLNTGRDGFTAKCAEYFAANRVVPGMLLQEWTKDGRIKVLPPGQSDPNAQAFYAAGPWRGYRNKPRDEDEE